MYYCCGITEKGIMPHNEDALLLGGDVLSEGRAEKRLQPPFIAAVSDGVSGERAGEVASRMCLEMVSGVDEFRQDGLKESLMGIHRRLAEYSRDDPDSRNMQTTLCGVAVNEDGGVAAFNVGDSRLYRFRAGRISQLSRDQSLVQLLYEEGSITKEERKTHIHRNIIFPAFGNVTTEPTIDVEEIDGMEYGDVLILCSDGLSDNLSAFDIQEIMELPKSLPKRLDMLVKAALLRGSTDNITVAAIVYEYEK